MRPAPQRPRVALVLGGGGFVGGAWLIGTLQALEAETGWSPSQASHLVGTSAGAMIAAMAACGVHPNVMPALFGGDDFGRVDASRPHPVPGGRPAGAILRLEPGLPRPVPASMRLALRALVHPRQYPRGTTVLGWLPRGIFSTQPLQGVVRRVLPTGWPARANVWVMACNLRTGDRVALGREGTPAPSLAEAVAASCAIPSVYHPVRIDGELYVDGGVHSASNLDVVAGEDFDLVLCLNPTSAPGRARRFSYSAASRRTVTAEAERLRAAGHTVHVVHPSAADAAAMGRNLMSVKHLDRVIESARASMLEALRGGELAELRSRLQPAAAPARVPGAPWARLLAALRGWPSRLPRPLPPGSLQEQPEVAG